MTEHFFFTALAEIGYQENIDLVIHVSLPVVFLIYFYLLYLSYCTASPFWVFGLIMDEVGWGND